MSEQKSNDCLDTDLTVRVVEDYTQKKDILQIAEKYQIVTHSLRKQEVIEKLLQLPAALVEIQKLVDIGKAGILPKFVTIDI